MAKYLDENGLDYFYQKLKAKFATIQDVVDEFMASYAYFYKHDESTYTTTGASESVIPVGITGFRSTDVLFVEVSGLTLIRGTDYTVSGTNITLATPITHAGTVVHFVALRASAANSSDYSALKGDPGSIEDAYPVGSIYLNASDSTNPAVLFGFGTWQRLGQGRMMIDADSTYTAGSTGGSATHNHDYGMQLAAYYGLPAFEQDAKTGVLQNGAGSPAGWSGNTGSSNVLVNNGAATASTSRSIYHYKSTAKTSADSNMPPYIAVYMWVRTA